MAKGQKTGGRKSGVPNRDRRPLIELLSEKYPTYHPVIALAEIAHKSKNEVLRFQANKEVAKYVSPQLKSVEVKEKSSAIFPDIDISEYTREELIELLKRCMESGQALPPMLTIRYNKSEQNRSA